MVARNRFCVSSGPLTSQNEQGQKSMEAVVSNRDERRQTGHVDNVMQPTKDFLRTRTGTLLLGSG